MDVREAAKLTGVSYSVALRLKTDGFLEDPVTDKCISLLQLTSHFCGNVWYIRRFSSKLSNADVKKILEGRKYTKVENYVISLYVNTERRLRVKEVMEMVQKYYGKPISRDQVLKLRDVAYKRRAKAKNEKK